MSHDSTKPDKISGGCLCQSIKYEIVFDKITPWPPPSATCQCTMCRKWTASLLTQFMVIAPEQIVPPLSSFAAYKEYSSSPRRFRGFCGNCGSPLIWRSEDKTDTLDLYLGTIDERWLVGQRVEGSEKKTKHGVTVERVGSLGKELCTPSEFQFYCENAIPGVTDLVPGGRKFLVENTDGVEELDS